MYSSLPNLNQQINDFTSSLITESELQMSISSDNQCLLREESQGAPQWDLEKETPVGTQAEFIKFQPDPTHCADLLHLHFQQDEVVCTVQSAMWTLGYDFVGAQQARGTEAALLTSKKSYCSPALREDLAS